MRQVSATELAKMGKCERQVYFDYHYGEDKSLTAAYIHKGNHEHEQFNRRLSGQDKRCFIATAVFGADAMETNILRQFRDEQLMPYFSGRLFVSFYYYISPYLVTFLKRHSLLMPPIRVILCLFIKLRRQKCPLLH